MRKTVMKQLVVHSRAKSGLGLLQVKSRGGFRLWVLFEVWFVEMGVSKEQVEASLTSKMSPSHLEVIDTSGGCGASFEITIVSEQFEGKRLLERHRMVNSALAEEMKEIHALSIPKALTPAQWKQQQESNTQSTS